MTQAPTPTPPPSPVAPPPAGDVEMNPQARTMGMLCHLLGIFTGWLGPLILWLVKKDEMPFVNDQGKEALNWEITVFGGWIVVLIVGAIFGAILGHIAIFLAMCFAWILYLAVIACNIIFCIMGCMKANQGIKYRYPFAIRLIK